MLRYNNTNEGIIKEYKNNNITIKLSDDAIENIKIGRYSDIEVISWLLDSLDSYFIGEEFYLSNYGMGITIYNCYSDVCYTLSFLALNESIESRNTLRLYAHTPSDAEREDIERWESE